MRHTCLPTRLKYCMKLSHHTAACGETYQYKCVCERTLGSHRHMTFAARLRSDLTRDADGKLITALAHVIT